MKHFCDTRFGAVDAVEDTDLRRVGHLLPILQQTWWTDVIHRFDAGQVAGLFAMAPAIVVHYVPPRGGKSAVQERVLLSPGLTYGSMLWEPAVRSLLDALRDAQLPQAFYARGLCSDISVESARDGAAEEIRQLRDRLAGVR